LQRVSLKTKAEKLSRFEAFLSHLRKTPKFGLGVNANFNTIVRDFEQDNAGPNYDPTNHLFAVDLLFLCSEICLFSAKDVSEEASILTNIQLDEMSSGMCPQGRNTRLFQIVCSFSEYLPNI
jgi:hypothetical protein